jgi:hypothetical protein
MLTVKEVPAIIISEDEALDLIARNRDKRVRVTPLKDAEGRWYIAPNVAQEMDAKKTYAFLDDHTTVKKEASVALVIESGDSDDNQLRIVKLNGDVEERERTQVKE